MDTNKQNTNIQVMGVGSITFTRLSIFHDFKHHLNVCSLVKDASPNDFNTYSKYVAIYSKMDAG